MKFLGPGVQHRGHPEHWGSVFGAETLLAERDQGDSRGVKQRLVHPRRVRSRDGAKLHRDRKYNVKVLGRQHAVHALLDPAGLSQRLAGWAPNKLNAGGSGRSCTMAA